MGDMKKIILFLLFFSINISAQNYFPIKVGNSWTYCGFNDTTFKRIYEIKDSVKFDSLNGFIYGLHTSSYNDTLIQDKSNNIHKIINTIPRLWFDFSKDSGAVYTVPINDSTSFFVHVRKNISTDTYIGNFSNCIELFFDIPQYIDDEMGYIFAPNIGIVKKYGAWANDVLFSIDTNDVPVNVNYRNSFNINHFNLDQNYPNPFNPSTTINYTIEKSGNAKIIIYNSLGGKVKTLVNEFKTPGNYKIQFNAENFASGIYYYRLISSNTIKTKSMIFLK